MLDTWASAHITNQRHIFLENSLRPSQSKIICANGQHMMATAIGDIRLFWDDNERQAIPIILRNVLLVPDADENL